MAQRADVYGATAWDLIEAEPDRFWAGTADGEIVTVFVVVQRDGGWVPDDVRLCAQSSAAL